MVPVSSVCLNVAGVIAGKVQFIVSRLPAGQAVAFFLPAWYRITSRPSGEPGRVPTSDQGMRASTT